MGKEYFTEKELCEKLKINRTTAYRWRKEGMPHIPFKREVRYVLEEVEQWLKNKQ